MKIKKLCRALVPVFLIGCVSTEPDSDLTVKPVVEKPLSEIFENMEKLPAIEDPDPEIEDLKYDELFAGAYSMRLMTDISSEDPMPLYLKNMLKNIGEQVRDVDPEMREMFEDASLNYLVGIMDPRVPIDPQVEQLLLELLERFKTELSISEVPTVDGLEALKSAVGYVDHRPPSDKVRDNGGDASCAQAVFMQYGSGARTCGQELNLALEMIESNYLRRMYEAELRLEERNQELRDFELERLPAAVAHFRGVLTAIREISTADEVEVTRANIGYLAAAYAYHLRLNLPLWHEYGAQLIEWYYYKEIELIAEIRKQKEAEADLTQQHCIDWVNGLIIEEVKASCPGDEPILY